MGDSPPNLVLDLLRAMRGDLSEIKIDLTELKQRVVARILGGVKGALAGILIGGGGVVAATDGQDVQLPAGSTLRVRLDSPLTLH